MNAFEYDFCRAAVHEGYYLETYPELRDSGIDPRTHFVERGVHEGRVPSPLFREDWYRQINKLEEGRPAFLHYVEHGLSTGRAPQPELPRLLNLTGEHLTAERASSLFQSLPANLPTSVLNTQLFGALFAFFDPEHYAEVDPELSKRVTVSASETIEAYLSRGMSRGVSFSRGFDPDFFLAQQGWSITGPGAILRTLRAWLMLQAPPPHAGQRVIASQNFDREFYLAHYPDVARANADPYYHYLLMGVREARRATPGHVVRLVSRLRHRSACRQSAYSVPRESEGDPQLPEIIRDLARSTQAPVFVEAYRRAQRIESGIQDLAETPDLLVPPRHDAASPLFEEIIQRLPRRPVRHVVIIPWVKMGGADFIASRFARALAELTDPSQILVIKADSPDEDRGAWFAGLNVVDFSDVLAVQGEAMGQKLLFQTLRLLAPKTVTNVNSRIAWSTIERYKSRLTDVCSVYSYLFCWDETPSGRRVGYPDNVGTSIGHLTGFFTDSEFLIRELCEKHLLPERARRKLVPLLTPPRPDEDACAATVDGSVRERPLVLWAGRFDRQKRVDILFDVAREMPDVDFHCWGKAILDQFSPGEVPPNLRMFEPFHDYEELPLGEAACWLYTADWDGTPTILIDLATLSVPLVASAVGGIGDLLGEDGAWLIPRDAAPRAYAEALREAIQNPDQRRERAGRAHGRVRQRHDWSRYKADVARALGEHL